MRNELYYNYGNFLTSAGHLLLLLFALRIGTSAAWTVCLALIGTASLFAWSANFRRSRVVADTPTSHVASAPQGYVELFGKARAQPGQSLSAPLSLRPCVWFRYLLEEKRGKNWQRVGAGMSSDTFLLDDGTGQAIIDPDCAEILTTDRRCWYRSGQRCTEWLLPPGGDLYALGEFATEGGQASALDATRDLNELLSQWKADNPKLLARFDLNGDAQVDLKEWQLARRAAQREIAKQHQEIRSQPGVHVMRKPRDGRLFLLSNLDPQRMARRYGLWTWLQLAFALGAAAGLVFVLTRAAVA